MALIEGVQDFYYNVNDMKAAVAFYRDVLGMKVVAENPYWATLDCRGATVGLHWTEGAAVPAVPGDDHGPHAGGTLTLRVKSARTARAALEKAGVRIRGASENPWGNVVVFEDPDGNVLKLMEPDPASRRGVVDAVLHDAKDLEALAGFYERGFGLKAPIYFGSDHLGTRAGVYLGFDRKPAGGGVVVWYRVHDIEAAVDRLVGLGAKVESRPDDTCSPGEVLAVLLDPEGHRFGLISDARE